MSAEISTPKAIWIITEEASETSTSTSETSITRGARSSVDRGGLLGDTQTTEEIVVSRKDNEVVITRRKVEVTKLKQEMKGFLQAMKEMLDEAEDANSKMQLDEVQLSVEISGEGQISLLGIGGGKAGGKGAMTFKFKRK
jgi:biotin synthase-related radical SAM superfamily protein